MGEIPLSVVMVSASFYPHVGGAERQALELSTALQARGLRVKVLTRRLPGQAPSEELRGVPVERLWCAGGGLLNALTFMLSLWRWLRLNSPFYEAIHVHLAGSPALVAALAGRLSGKRVIVKLGGGKGIGELAVSSRGLAGRLKLRLLRWLGPQFSAVTGELVEEARRHLGAVTVHVIPNGVDAKRFRPASPAERAAARARLGWPEGLGFLYVGRFSPEKRLPYFLELFADELKRANAKAFFAMVGEGGESALIRSEIERLRLSGKAFLSAPLEDVSLAYAAADVFVLPSMSEGLSNALLESMSSGLGVLASRVGGSAEAVEDGRAGLLFDAGSADDLRRQLGKLLARPDLAPRLGAAARQTALDRYSIDKVAERYELLYRFAV